jgi:hypothetical protein
MGNPKIYVATADLNVNMHLKKYLDEYLQKA